MVKASWRKWVVTLPAKPAGSRLLRFQAEERRWWGEFGYRWPGWRRQLESQPEQAAFEVRQRAGADRAVRRQGRLPGGGGQAHAAGWQRDRQHRRSREESPEHRLLGWSEIRNKAEYKSQLQSVSVSSANDGAGAFVSNMPAACSLPTTTAIVPAVPRVRRYPKAPWRFAIRRASNRMWRRSAVTRAAPTIASVRSSTRRKSRSVCSRSN